MEKVNSRKDFLVSFKVSKVIVEALFIHILFVSSKNTDFTLFSGYYVRQNEALMPSGA